MKGSGGSLRWWLQLDNRASGFRLNRNLLPFFITFRVQSGKFMGYFSFKSDEMVFSMRWPGSVEPEVIAPGFRSGRFPGCLEIRTRSQR
jgi:hypothetical protein